MPDSTALNMDIIKPAGPALSATSDMPVIQQAETTDAADTAAETTETTATETTETVETAAEGDEAATGADDKAGDDATDSDKSGKDETPAWMKRKITKARNRQREAERIASEREAQLNTALKALERVTGKPEQPKDGEDPRPNRQTFDDPDAYEDALIQWSTRQATKTAKVEADKERVQTEQRTRIEGVQRNWNEKVAKVADKFPDFDEVVYADDITITPVMTNVIAYADNGPELAYHLATHQDEAKRIAKLDPPAQALEIGKLAASLVEKPGVSKAPPPVRPVRTVAAATRKTPEEMSMEEYAAYRKEQSKGARARA